MATRENEGIGSELLDRLLGGRDPAEVFRSGALIDELKKAVAERALDAEMDAHLESEGGAGSGNHRNGHNRKRVPADGGSMDLEVPRDRDGRFDPRLVEKYRRRLPGFDERVVSMYARGMTTREIRNQIGELYGVSVSAELIPKVTDPVHEEIREWQSRPLEEVYAIVYFDALRVKIRDEGLVRNKAVHLAIGVTCAGRKEILGMWISRQEGAGFWLGVMNELKARGTRDILIAVVDGLKGFPQAIESVFPEAAVQTRIPHLVRGSLAHASHRDRKPVASALKEVYGAATAEAAAAALDAFEWGEWGERYPMIAKSWRAHWERVIPFFAFSGGVGKAVCTTNAIESLNSVVRRAVRTRGHFPNDRAAAKLIYLAPRGVGRKWLAPPAFWSDARREVAIRFGDRFRVLES